MRILVLGGGGFIGINLCRRLRAIGYEVIGFGHPPRFPEAVSGISWIEGDISDAGLVGQAIKDVDCVVHMACSSTPVTSDEAPALDIERNLVPSIRLLEAMADRGPKKIVFLSSGGTVYGASAAVPARESTLPEPSCSYGVVKLAIEKYLQLFRERHGIEYASLRVSNPYGPYQLVTRQQGVIASFISKAVEGQEIEIWGDGSAERDFLFIDDVVDAIVLSIARMSGGRILNIGSGEGRSISSVLRAIEKVHGRPLNTSFVTGKFVGVPRSVLDISKARAALGWTPATEWQSGIEQTYEWVAQTSSTQS